MSEFFVAGSVSAVTQHWWAQPAEQTVGAPTRTCSARETSHADGCSDQRMTANLRTSHSGQTGQGGGGTTRGRRNGRPAHHPEWLCTGQGDWRISGSAHSAAALEVEITATVVVVLVADDIEFLLLGFDDRLLRLDFVVGVAKAFLDLGRQRLLLVELGFVLEFLALRADLSDLAFGILDRLVDVFLRARMSSMSFSLP